MSKNGLHSLSTSIGPTAIALQSRPSDGWNEVAIAAVFPRALRESAAIKMAAYAAQRGREVGPVGGQLSNVHWGDGTKFCRGDLKLAITVRGEHSVPPPRPRLGAAHQTGSQLVELVEVLCIEDHDGELDEDLVAELGAETTVHPGAKPPCEGFQKDRASVGVLVADGGESSDDLICVRRPIWVPNGSHQRCRVRVPDEIWLHADPAGGKGSVGESLVAGADLLLEGGHGVPSVDGVVSSTVRNCGPRFGPSGGPDVRIRVWRLEYEGPGCGPGFGPGPCSGLVSVEVAS